MKSSTYLLLFHAFLRKAQETLDQGTELNYSKLEITIALNRSDVAREKVFLPGLKWNVSIYCSPF